MCVCVCGFGSKKCYYVCAYNYDTYNAVTGTRQCRYCFAHVKLE